MSDRRLRILLAAIAVSIVALVASAAGQAAPPTAARDLAQIYFANALTRAEVLTYVGRVEHDYKIDEGRVVAVRPNTIDLLERDGTRQTIAIGPQTVVVGVGRLFAPNAIQRGTRVVTVREGSGPATQIRPSGTAKALGRLFFGAALVRAEVLNYQAKALHDYRIDEGRIVSVKPTSLTLLERDGTRQAISVSAATVFTIGGQPVDQSNVGKGLTAVTIRESDGPATQVMLAAGGLVVGRG